MLSEPAGWLPFSKEEVLPAFSVAPDVWPSAVCAALVSVGAAASVPACDGAVSPEDVFLWITAAWPL